MRRDPGISYEVKCVIVVRRSISIFPGVGTDRGPSSLLSASRMYMYLPKCDELSLRVIFALPDQPCVHERLAQM